MDDVFEAENALVELDPLVHLAELDVSDDVVEREQPVPGSGRAVRRKRPVPRRKGPSYAERATNVWTTSPYVAMLASSTRPCSSSPTNGSRTARAPCPTAYSNAALHPAP